MEAKEHGAGQEQEAAPYREGAGEDQQDEGDQIGDQGAVEVGGDAQDHREEHKDQGEEAHRLPHGQQAQQTAEGDGDALSALKAVKEGEGVADDRSGQRRGKEQRGEVQRPRPGQEEMDG